MNVISRRHFLKLAGASTALVAAVPTMLRAQSATPKGRVVVVGGGFGGATVAKYLRLWGGNSAAVTLVDANPNHVSCILSNMVLDGSLNLSQITFNYSKLHDKYGVNFVQAKATGIDSANRVLKLSSGKTLPYEHLVLAPGIDFKPIDGLDFSKIPHAWQAGPQTTLLKQQLQQLVAGTVTGDFVITVPPSPFRCPIGPYERACLVADYLKRNGKSGSKVVMLDANASIVAEVATFTKAFNQTFAGIIDYRPGVQVLSVDSNRRIITTNKGEFQAGVLNVIPAHQAGAIVRNAGLVDLTTTNWGAPVNPLNYESTLLPNSGIHIIGDSQGTAMSKGGHVANGEAKVCADAILRALDGGAPDPAPTVGAACFNPVTANTGSWLSTLFVYDPATKTMVKAVPPGTVEAPVANTDNFEKIFEWSANLFADTFA